MNSNTHTKSEQIQQVQTRIAGFRRVSTELQKRKGESLLTQTADVLAATNSLGGQFIEWYGGQEHATPGFETLEMDRLIRDAQANPRRFDAIMVSHIDRWSRNNAKSSENLDTLKRCGIRFFVLSQEFPLHDPSSFLQVSMFTTIAQFHAQNQSLKSVRNRIARAERGYPTSGGLPYGRTFDKNTGKWGLIESKREMIEAIASRYLKGEWLANLAREYGVDRSCLYVILREKCGPIWNETFHSEGFKIHAVVSHTVPPLLTDEVIKMVAARTASNRTIHHKRTGNRYLLGGAIICAHCGGALSGQPNPGGKLFYRHMQPNMVKKQCLVVKSYIPAADIDDQVIRQLFETFGNPIAVKQAIRAAIPNPEEREKSSARLQEVENLIHRVATGRERILKLVRNGHISEEQSHVHLSDLKVEETTYQGELSRLQGTAALYPSKEEVEAKGNEIAEGFKSYAPAKLWVERSRLNSDISTMSWEDKRALIEMIFDGVTADLRRMGVQIEWLPPDGAGASPKWRYSIVGHFVNEAGWQLFSPERRMKVFADCNARGQRRLVRHYAGY